MEFGDEGLNTMKLVWKKYIESKVEADRNDSRQCQLAVDSLIVSTWENLMRTENRSGGELMIANVFYRRINKIFNELYIYFLQE